MKLNPARSGGDRLPPIFRTPPFDEAHSDGTHPGQLVNGFKTLVHGLGEERSKLLVVEDLEVTTGRNFAHLKQGTEKNKHNFSSEFRFSGML